MNALDRVIELLGVVSPWLFGAIVSFVAIYSAASLFHTWARVRAYKTFDALDDALEKRLEAVTARIRAMDAKEREKMLLQLSDLARDLEGLRRDTDKQKPPPNSVVQLPSKLDRLVEDITNTTAASPLISEQNR